MAKSRKLRLTQELEAIVQTLYEFPDGAGRETIRQAMNLPIEPKTLQRRLAMLVEQGKVEATGATGGTQYRLVQTGKNTGDPSLAVKQSDGLVLSNKGELLLAAMRRPANQRKAVGYNLSFLDNYKPNVDFYLINGKKKFGPNRQNDYRRTTGRHLCTPNPKPFIA